MLKACQPSSHPERLKPWLARPISQEVVVSCSIYIEEASGRLADAKHVALIIRDESCHVPTSSSDIQQLAVNWSIVKEGSKFHVISPMNRAHVGVKVVGLFLKGYSPPESP